MQLAALLTAINACHGTRLSLGPAYAGGEQGAVAIIDETGKPLVLKWGHDPSIADRFRSAQVATETLRRLGYPAPHYRYGGVIGETGYSIHEALPGQPLGTVMLSLLPRLLELNRLQRERSPLPADDWWHWLVQSVLVGCGSYCLPQSLEAYSPRTRALLDRLQALASTVTDVPMRTTDIVHLDFHPGNILVQHGAISGVIDWDGVRSGDASFDLVTLLFYTRDAAVRQVLWSSLDALSSPAAIGLGLAHLVVRQLDWSIRYHADPVVTGWIDRAATVLAERDQRTNL